MAIHRPRNRPTGSPPAPLVGLCGVAILRGTEEGEIWYLVEPESWGKGLATEAAKRLLDFGFANSGFTPPAFRRIPHRRGFWRKRACEKKGSSSATSRSTECGRAAFCTPRSPMSGALSANARPYFHIPHCSRTESDGGSPQLTVPSSNPLRSPVADHPRLLYRPISGFDVRVRPKESIWPQINADERRVRLDWEGIPK